MLSKLFSSLLIWVMGVLPHAAPVVAPTPSAANPYFISSTQHRSYASVIHQGELVKSTPKFNSYLSSFVSDGLTEYALLNIPTGKVPSGGWPVVILNHGHIAPAEYSTINSYAVPAADFANAGFLVLKPDYRGNGKSQGAADGLLNRLDYTIDVLNLLSAVHTLPAANPDRIYMWGHSMGGDVTLRALEICGNCVRAASLWAPAVTDWPESMLYFVRRNHDQAWLARVQSELDKNFSPADYSRVSSLDYVQLIKVSLNLHQGTADESVPYSWGLALNAKLTSANIAHTFYSYPEDNHNLTHSWSTAISRDIKLFNDTK